MNQICIGIPTLGKPVLEKAGAHILLRNMLIGKDFHWQKSIEALLPGEILINDDPVFRIINRLPLETYLECVVGSEMNPEAPTEFLKAHAVISRSWAVGKINGAHQYDTSGKHNSPELIVNWEDTSDHTGFHVCSDDHCQRYQGIQPIREEILEAIRETEGLVLKAKDGSLVDTRFSKCCGGKTELFSSCWQDTDPPCLESFDDSWCDLSNIPEEDRNKVLRSILKDYDLTNNGGYRWHTEVAARDVEENLRKKFGREVGEINDLVVTSRGASGRAIRMRIIGSRGSLEIGKELMIRRLLSPTHLYSSAFTITKQPAGCNDALSQDCTSEKEVLSEPDSAKSGRFLIEGSGWGHGVGLCQIGAARMALEGHDFRTILSFYYPGSHLTTID